MTTIDRRLSKLEQDAPAGVCRPDGLTGESFVSFVIGELCNAEGRTVREQTHLRQAWLSLMTHDELHICETSVKASIATITDAEKQPTTGRSTA